MRSRLTAYASGCILGIALCAWGLGGWILSLPNVGVKSMPFVYVLILAPVLVASAIGSGVHSPFGETERTAARPLSPLRFGHFFGLISLASLALVLVAFFWRIDGDDTSHTIFMLVRNVGGFTGIAFFTALILGGKLSWVSPLVFSMYVLLRGLKPDGVWARWAWPARPATDELSWVIPLVLLVAGLILVCVFGPCESAHDSELGDG
ncbi:hypothetical protein BH24ACT21_BH24ACT21_09250 [soil metagenome]